MATRIPWSSGSWTTPPRAVAPSGDDLAVEAAEGSDFWESTLYGFQHRDGHALLAPWDARHAVEVSFRLSGFDGLYDQAGVLLWHDTTHWIKAGVEINDGVPHLAVVVTDGASDWSLAPVPDWHERVVTVRASRMRDAVILRARMEPEAWRTLRVARFDDPTSAQAGPYLCAPTRAGLRVTFTNWAHSAPDSDLHADPPRDESRD